MCPSAPSTMGSGSAPARMKPAATPSIEPGAGRDPDHAIAILRQPRNIIPRQPLAHGPAGETIFVVTAQTIVRADPQRA